MRDYEFADVVDHTRIDRNQLRRWCEIGLVKTGGGGSQGKRRVFSLWNLIEVVVLDELHFFGFSERAMDDAICSLRQHWTQGLAEPRHSLVAWFARQRLGVGPTNEPPYTDILLLRIIDATMTAHALTEPAAFQSLPEVGLLVPLGRFIQLIEAVTGDVLVGEPARSPEADVLDARAERRRLEA